MTTAERLPVPTTGNPRRTFRFEPGLWTAFLDAAKRDPHGRVPAVIVRDFISWYVSQRGARKPERPPRQDSAEQ